MKCIVSDYLNGEIKIINVYNSQADEIEEIWTGMIIISIDEQKSLFDLNLKMVDAPKNEQFIDEFTKRLNMLEWHSEPMQTFYHV